MKRLCSTDSLGALMSICRTADRESNPRNCHVYGREFQSMLEGFDEEGCVEESVQIMGEKKRRLSVNQVKALEKNFEVENKLEPERKLKLAQELGLQPRQIAVWFQNRRARWKTKQLERDYALLKAKYDALNQNYESLRLDHEALLQEIRELKEKMNEEENSEGNPPVKDKSQSPAAVSALAAGGSDGKIYSSGDGQFIDAIPIFPDLKDGSSESDSSAILNEETHNSPSAAISSSAVLQNAHFFASRPPASSLGFNSSSSSSHDSKDCFEFSSTSSKNGYQPPSFVKMEEHNFFGGEEECNFFSEEQAPTLHWYCPEQWN